MQPRESLKILADHCPLHPIPLATCPLSEVHAIAPEKRKEYIESLSEKEVEALVRGHVLCVCRSQGCHTELPPERPPVEEDDDDLDDFNPFAPGGGVQNPPHRLAE